MARNVAKLFSSNRAVAHFYAACCINELSKGSILGSKFSQTTSDRNVPELLAESCVSVLCCFNKRVDHGGRRGNRAHALAQWRHPVASSEALDVLHWAMRPASYCRIHMAIDIASNWSAFSLSSIHCCPLT